MTENNNGKREVVVDHPAYQGFDRRKETLTVAPCDCHKKHERILSDHDGRIVQLESHHYADTSALYAEIRTKTPNKLFYFIVGLFFVSTLATLGTILMQIHAVDKAVAVVAIQVTANSKFNEKIEGAVETIKRDINTHMINQDKRDVETDRYRKHEGRD